MQTFDDVHRLRPELADRLARELTPDEHIVWFGQPRVDLVMRQAFILVPIGILLVGFAAFWILVTAIVTHGLMTPCGLPFLIGALGMLLSPVWLRSKANQTVYALTNRRATIWRPGWFGRFSVQSFTAGGLGQMSRVERPDGAGDLVFQIYTTVSGDEARTYRSGFLGINNVRGVEELVRATLQTNM